MSGISLDAFVSACPTLYQVLVLALRSLCKERIAISNCGEFITGKEDK